MIKIIVHWILSALSFMLTAHFIPGFIVENFTAALIAAAVMGILNIMVWPILMFLTLPFTILTLGLFLFIVNAMVLKFGAALVPGFQIIGFLPAILAAVFMVAISWLVKILFEPEKDEQRF